MYQFWWRISCYTSGLNERPSLTRNRSGGAKLGTRDRAGVSLTFNDGFTATHYPGLASREKSPQSLVSRCRYVLSVTGNTGRGKPRYGSFHDAGR